MTAAVIAIFTLAYAVVALEHPLRVNKAATALVGAGLMWTVYAVMGGDAPVASELNESVASTAQIIFSVSSNSRAAASSTSGSAQIVVRGPTERPCRSPTASAMR